MKKNVATLSTISVICLFLLSLAQGVQAESRFVKGFRGIAWGTHKEQLPDLGLSKKALKNIYASGPASVLFMEGKGTLALRFDDIPLLSVFMHFNDQLFTGDDLLFRPEDREKVLSIITSETGAPSAGAGGEKQWQVQGVDITVTDREVLVTTVKE